MKIILFLILLALAYETLGIQFDMNNFLWSGLGRIDGNCYSCDVFQSATIQSTSHSSNSIVIQPYSNQNTTVIWNLEGKYSQFTSTIGPDGMLEDFIY